MISTVIFDLDGTLLYTLEDLTDSTNYVLSKFKYPVKTIDNIRCYVGDGVSKLIERAIPDGINNPKFHECLNIFTKHYSQNMYNKTRPYADIIDMLKMLKSRHIKTAIVSNKFDSAVKELTKKYFPNLIDIAFGQRENIAPKPSPAIVNEVLGILKTTPCACLYAGDSEIDIQTAKNAGIECISTAWGYKSIDFLRENGAVKLIRAPYELIDYIDGSQTGV